MQLIDIVKFNSGIAFVFDEEIKLKYKRLGKLIYGTDGTFYKCYYYEEPGGSFWAFAGRKFDINLESGEIVKCYGQWWDGGYGELSKLLDIELIPATASDTKSLKSCYVYYGYFINKNKHDELVSSYDGPIHRYRDYEKILNYDDLRRKYFNFQYKSGRAKEKLISNVKLFHSKLKNIKQELSDIKSF